MPTYLDVVFEYYTSKNMFKTCSNLYKTVPKDIQKLIETCLILNQILHLFL